MLAPLVMAGLALAGRAALRLTDVPHEELARELLARAGLDERADVDALLGARFARLRVGAFALYLPADALGERERCDSLRAAVSALVAVQSGWLAWHEPEAGERGGELAAARARLEQVGLWVQTWKPGVLAGAAAGGVDLADAAGAKEEVRAALLGVARYMESGGPLGRDAAEPIVANLVLLPSREDFVAFACALGLLRTHLRGAFWVAGLETWTELVFDGWRAVALEYSDGGSDFRRGTSMNAKNPRGLEEQVAQLGALSLFAVHYGAKTDTFFATGLANNLVIELFGEVDTRTDGDLSSRASQTWGGFVPGAPSAGGTLPPNPADSRWRSEKGKFHFVRPLRSAQKQAEKKARKKSDKLVSFQLESSGARDTLVVRAPFLGAAGQSAAAPPPEFSGDWLEFLRAYRVAFLFWLREHGAGRTEPSQRAFAQLLRCLAEGTELASALETTYALPVSGAELERDDSLEGRFLHWLSKQR